MSKENIQYSVKTVAHGRGLSWGKSILQNGSFDNFLLPVRNDKVFVVLKKNASCIEDLFSRSVVKKCPSIEFNKNMIYMNDFFEVDGSVEYEDNGKKRTRKFAMQVVIHGGNTLFVKVRENKKNEYYEVVFDEVFGATFLIDDNYNESAAHKLKLDLSINDCYCGDCSLGKVLDSRGLEEREVKGDSLQGLFEDKKVTLIDDVDKQSLILEKYIAAKEKDSESWLDELVLTGVLYVKGYGNFFFDSFVVKNISYGEAFIILHGSGDKKHFLRIYAVL